MRAADDGQLLFCGEVVADITVVESCRPGAVQVPDEQRYDDRIPRACAEDFSALLARQFTSCPLVASEI